MCAQCKKERQSLAKIKYQEGNILNEKTGSILIKRIDGLRGVIECGKCHQQYEGLINSATRGHYCKECGNEYLAENKIQYRVGDYISFFEYGTSFLFKQELDPYIDEKGKKHRRGIFDMVELSTKKIIRKDIEARLDSVCQGIVSGKNISLASRKMETILQENNFSYKKEKIFEDLRSTVNEEFHLRVDFVIYLESITIAVEVDGEQHNKSVEYWGGEKQLKIRQNNDLAKEKYFSEKEGYLLWRFSESEIKKNDFEDVFLKKINPYLGIEVI